MHSSKYPLSEGFFRGLPESPHANGPVMIWMGLSLMQIKPLSEYAGIVHFSENRPCVKTVYAGSTRYLARWLQLLGKSCAIVSLPTQRICPCELVGKTRQSSCKSAPGSGPTAWVSFGANALGFRLQGVELRIWGRAWKC